MAAFDITEYGVTRQNGFLSTFEADEIDLPGDLHPVREMALNLPKILPTGMIRSVAETLPLVDLAEFSAEAELAQRRVAMVHYTFLTQAFVWGADGPPKSLPKNIALPLWQLASSMDLPPLLTYSDYVLDNWSRIDKAGPVDLSNITMLQPFLSGQDEAWFVLIHVAIEARAGDMLAMLPAMIEAADQEDFEALERGLEQIHAVWLDMNAIFDRMPERCDPYVYFHRVRPWIHGWKDNPALGKGLIYEGVDVFGGKPVAFRGQTGSQSSIVPSMDAFLGVVHASDPLRVFLDELHAYRPVGHRRFIEHLRAESSVREKVQAAGRKPLTDLYNASIEEVTRFRTRHLEYAASYIHKQAKGAYGNDTDVGTGGTPFMKYLKKHRDEAEAHVIANRL